MHRRLNKELAPLFLPWTIAVAAGALAALSHLLDLFLGSPPAPNSLADLVLGLLPLAPWVFCVSLAILAAMSFGTEFQHRTLALYLSQPLERSRLWREKLLVVAIAVVAAVMIYGGVWIGADWVSLRWFPGANGPAPFPTEAAVSVAVFVLATVCSAGFWTLSARSTIGGSVFTVSSQFLAWMGVGYAAEKILRPDAGAENGVMTATLVVAGLVYSASFLWLGERKFVRLELRHGAFGEALLPSGSASALEGWADWLRCRRTSAGLNLLRKELRLQQPVFLMAGVFALVWLIARGLFSLLPQRQELFELLFDVLTALYVPVVLLLAGSVTLGEEKNLGLAAWQLTLPISARRQWLVKLAAAAATALFLGCLLPLVLAGLNRGSVGDLGVRWRDVDEFALVAFLGSLCVVIGFWTMSFSSSTIRAVLRAVVALAALGACGFLGSWCGANWGRVPAGNSAGSPGVVIIMLIPLMVAALAQSLTMYRRAQTRTSTVVRYALILGFLSFVPWFWITDLQLPGTAMLVGLALLLIAAVIASREFASGRSVAAGSSWNWRARRWRRS